MEGVRAYGLEEAKAILDDVGDEGRSLSKSVSGESSGILALSSQGVSGVPSSRASEPFSVFSCAFVAASLRKPRSVLFRASLCAILRALRP